MRKTLAPAEIAPNNPESWFTLAKFYSEKVQKDTRLPRDLAKKYVLTGLAAEDKALAINPDYYEALSLKDVLLRQRARYEKEPAVRKRLIAEADVLKAKAAALLRKYKNGVLLTAASESECRSPVPTGTMRRM